MKIIRARASVALALGIVASGILPFTTFYLLGLHVWAWIGLGMIPFGLGCWGLSSVLPGSRYREICANLTASEREQATKMVRAYGRRMALWLVPVVVVVVVLMVSCALHANPEGRVDVFDRLVRNQVWLAAAGLALVVALALIGLPAGIKQHRAMRDFLRETEYARRTCQAGHAP